ncbi:bifunctional 4-hydroxy-2-oxoglutarate aldolase/2-dehydro-3-deoxy-phosphogluconate aldolase [Flavihumibacter rivuli]|uniref:bifunctional 4-hydroxy-2-oxoglutarate aldolase/2-dehydro-3-deoxy-phosphogluconate aldolase n=1 Tax=Flavihumibacter rivuli TaxID=2838156 RepID=UPI001BDDD1F3|nr:bifunctional 4-hydroxy-2-oxoglutarate aldolase/2-dehydro-3-deoxy-phosphogluconate aldolase [Flavihumibacter rivuli]ULQ57001.1 bifunctional 4-hydroxy-2-oxoglutarate aldolase/2-dehydro-3-deoxy-phosphogluconate aldolase [Flavihumibacter rivuli]
MSSSGKILDAIKEQLVLPLFYHDSPELSLSVIKALYNAGVRVVEYTNRGDHALENFRLLKSTLLVEAPGIFLGAGTVKTAGEARAFMDAGADFLVSPVVDPEVGELARHNGLLWVPGCMTPTEIQSAVKAGASLVKMFPGNVLGPGFIAAIKDLFPGTSFMPTGGVELEEENMRGWFRAGAVAVGMGSRLISKEILTNKNLSQLETDTQIALRIARSAKA